MKRITDATILEFVPTRPQSAEGRRIARDILKAGYEWRFRSRHYKRKEETKDFMRSVVHSLSMRLNKIPEVSSVMLPGREGKAYFKEAP